MEQNSEKNLDETLNFINGKWVKSKGEKLIDNINPAQPTQILGKIRNSTLEEVNEAFDVAHKAFKSWRKVPAPKRGQILFKAMEIMTREVDNIARDLTREEGKIFSEARGEVLKAINVLEFIAGEGRRIGGYQRPSEMDRTFCYTRREPLGVVGVITPWNFPVCIPVWKIAPAILAGNTVVFKPASNTPLCARWVTRIFEEAGVPAGVINLIYGSGGMVGDAMVKNPHTRAISFTGSTEIGLQLYAQGASKGIRVQCEMGGKNPLVILKDANLELAAIAACQGGFGSTGQRCTATSRVVIEESVADQFVEILLKKMDTIKPGDGLSEGVTMGPSVDESQFKTVLDYIEIGKTEDKAVLLKGGKRVDIPGYFVEPTLFDHVKREMRIAKEEIFGPVLSILRVKDFEEALEVANDCEFGLSSSLYSNDSAKIFRFIDEIETGITHINSPTMGGEAQLPFGGMKNTGVGGREMNEESFHFYTETKTVYVDYTGQKRETNIY